MEIIYRGSHPSPKFKHGKINLERGIGIIQSRSYDGRNWMYTILTESITLYYYEVMLERYN